MKYLQKGQKTHKGKERSHFANSASDMSYS